MSGDILSIAVVKKIHKYLIQLWGKNNVY